MTENFKLIEIKLEWWDIFLLINGPDGWRQRQKWNLHYYTKISDDSCEWGSGGAIWRGVDFQLVLMGDVNKTSLISLTMDNNKSSSDEAKQIWNELNILLQKLSTNKNNKKSGRPNNSEDIWAWTEIHMKGRPKKEVKPEWLNKLRNNPKRSKIAENPSYAWRDITKYAWGQKLGKNT